MELKNKGVLVTGGASGLGAACVHLLAEQGARIVIADVNSEGGESLAAELRARGASVSFAPTDVTSEESVQTAIRIAVEQYGGLHILINCAGVATPGKVLSHAGANSLEAFQKVITINLIGTFNVLRLAAAYMRENEPEPGGERGVIINTASVAAFDGQIGQAAYAASKGGIASMTLPIARELARYGIRVMTIAPGIFDTPLMAGLPAAARQSLEQQVPFPPRLGRPEEYAALARHIMENEMLNGECIRLDGSLRMGIR